MHGGVDIRDGGTGGRAVTFNGSGNILIDSPVSNGTAGQVGALIYTGTGM